MRTKQTWLIAILLIPISGIIAMRAQAQQEEFGKTSQADRQVSLLVKELMENRHLSSRSLDDTISRRAFDLFVKSLDPMKVYFEQQDIDELSIYRESLDDEMRQGRYNIAFKVFKRYLDRVDERVQTVLELLEKDFDFTLDEDMVTDADQIEFSKSSDEM